MRDGFRKHQWTGFFLCFSFFWLSFFASTPAFAVSALKQVQVSGGNEVDLLFDSNVDLHAVKAEFYQDIIQISLNNVSVYPPKIFSVDSSDVTKVFAYQYTPKLVRCRLTVKGNADTFKDRVMLKASGKMLTLKIAAAKDRIWTQAAKAVSAPKIAEKPADKSFEKISEAPKAAAVAIAAIAKPQDQVVLQKVLDSESKPIHLTGEGLHDARHSHVSSPVRQMARMFGYLMLTIMIFGGVLLAIKKIGKGKGFGRAGGLIKKLRGKFGVKDQLIEVIATHYLGPKKSIAVVRIQGQRLVVGITEDSINLITELGEDASVAAAFSQPQAPAQPARRPASPAAYSASMGAGAESAGPSVFADVLGRASNRPAASTPEVSHHTSTLTVREQIRRKMEGMKSL